MVKTDSIVRWNDNKARCKSIPTKIKEISYRPLYSREVSESFISTRTFVGISTVKWDSKVLFCIQEVMSFVDGCMLVVIKSLHRRNSRPLFWCWCSSWTGLPCGCWMLGKKGLGHTLGSYLGDKYVVKDDDEVSYIAERKPRALTIIHPGRKKAPKRKNRSSS